MNDFEKLGQFYLGRELDLKSGETSAEPLLYDSRDLTTHAVVVGMTGSGKTGLCLDLLEEAGLDRIPAIVIDPKGDIANLLLTFPDLQASDFRPWIDASQASREGMTPEVFAENEAAKWRNGLASWGQDGSRIRALRDTVDLQIFTPGSSAGRPVTVLKSFSAPARAVREDADAFRERVVSAVSGLLALLDIDADPIRSREHILLSNILNAAWSEGRDLSLAQLIAEIQKPPFAQVGIMDLDTFFPVKDRMALAMTMNNLLASPSFAAWMTGETLDIKRLLHTDEGKPRISIMSIAHLNDAERMFFVTILLNEVLTWMRSQAGTSSLRAILYMDEVFGYFPPTANPPSKQPMLTLLKQARAFGLGVVLATQNPVDLDYKGLSNTGTWFLGRLQTERDKARVIEGLEGAAANTGAPFDRGEMEAILAGLGARRFLMNNVHEDQPVVFETRWAMSYLRGPLTRSQIQQLVGESSLSKDDKDSAGTVDDSSDAESGSAGANRNETTLPEALSSEVPGQDPRQMIPSVVTQKYGRLNRLPGETERIVYRPALFGAGRVHYVRATCDIDLWKDLTFLASVIGNASPDEIWNDSQPLTGELKTDLQPLASASFSGLPSEMQQEGGYRAWEKQFKDYLYRCQQLKLLRCRELKLTSEPDETRGDFVVRLEQTASEHRDTELSELRNRYASKFDSLRKRIRKAEDKIESEKEQYKRSRLDSILSVGGSIMGALLGRKAVSVTNTRRAKSSMRSVGKTLDERGDIGRAEDKLEDLQKDWESLESKFNADVEALEEKLRVDQLELEEIAIPSRKSDIAVTEVSVVWLPFRVDEAGIAEPAYIMTRSD